MSQPNHPCTLFENTPAWRTVNEAVQRLVDHGDLEETTPREYIVGYLVTQLYSQDVIHDADEDRPRSAPANLKVKSSA